MKIMGKLNTPKEEVFDESSLRAFNTNIFQKKNITAPSSAEKTGAFKKAELQLVSSYKQNTLQIFLNQPPIACCNEWLQ